MKRLLIIDNASNCLDMALRAQLAGWDVRWYDKPRPDGSPRLAGMGMIKNRFQRAASQVARLG
jgi:phosphoribosylamine---glycine ligase